MKTLIEPKPKILKFKSLDPLWPRYACAVPGEPTEWFASQIARDTYAAIRSQQTRFEVKEVKR